MRDLTPAIATYTERGSSTTVSVRNAADELVLQRVFRDPYAALDFALSLGVSLRDGTSQPVDPQFGSTLQQHWEHQLEAQADAAAMMHAYHPLTGHPDYERDLAEAEMYGEARYHDRRYALDDLETSMQEFFHV